LRQASEDALDRAEEIASGSRGKVGKLQNASMGVFQIVGKNAGEDYSWGGAFNTSSRQKTISVTVRATYALR
ncbi:MAG: SIMPL domain-containing protein, partial [Porphyromonas asaccharolytica]